jgi:hypothetical protein
MTSPLAVLSAAILAAVLTPGAKAQAAPSPQPPPATATTADPLAAAPVPRISLRFAGGTLAEFVAAVRAAGTGINVVSSSLADRVPVPAVTLTDVAVDEALRAVGDVVPGTFRVKVDGDRQPKGKPVFSIAVAEAPRGPTATAIGPNGMVTGDEPFRIVKVFSLRELTRSADGGGIDKVALASTTVLSAVEAGLGIGGGAKEPTADLRYHEDSGLLFVRGTPEQTGLVHEVLRNLTEDVQRMRSTPSKKAPAGPDGGVESVGPQGRAK